MVYLDASKIKGGGIGRYINELIINCRCYDYYIGDIDELKKYCKIDKIIDKTYFINHINDFNNGNLVIHFPANDMGGMEQILPNACKVILTIHDVIPLVIKESTRKKQKVWFEKVRYAANRANVIITVSKYSQTDIINYLDVNKDKVYVIYNGISNCFYTMNDDVLKSISYKKNSDFLLMCTGSLLRHKNLWRILIAFRLSKNYKRSRLLIIKKNKLIFRVILILLGLRKRIELIGGNISDSQMNIYYNLVHILIFPSLYEGFGLPPLEAMACGTPVLCSNTSSLPEIVKTAALYVNPYDILDIKRGIDEIERDASLRRQLIQKGYDQIQKYNWNETGKQVDIIINKLNGTI